MIYTISEMERQESIIDARVADYRSRIHDTLVYLDNCVNVLHRNGFRKCDIAACNCGSWHPGPNLRAEKAELHSEELLEVITELLRHAPNIDPQHTIHDYDSVSKFERAESERKAWEQARQKIDIKTSP